MNKENVIYIYIERENIIQPLKKKETVICNNMNESRGHYAKQNKPDRESHILHNLIYMWNLKQSKSLKQKVER